MSKERRWWKKIWAKSDSPLNSSSFSSLIKTDGSGCRLISLPLWNQEIFGWGIAPSSTWHSKRNWCAGPSCSFKWWFRRELPAILKIRGGRAPGSFCPETEEAAKSSPRIQKAGAIFRPNIQSPWLGRSKFLTSELFSYLENTEKRKPMLLFIDVKNATKHAKKGQQL